MPGFTITVLLVAVILLFIKMTMPCAFVVMIEYQLRGIQRRIDEHSRPVTVVPDQEDAMQSHEDSKEQG